MVSARTTQSSPPSAMPVILTVLAVLAMAAAPVAAAPCPYNASADLDSLLEKSESLLRKSEDRDAEGGKHFYPTYARCDPFYEGDIFLDGMEPWADPQRAPGDMEPAVQLWPGGVIYYTASVSDPNVLHILNISIADLESRTATSSGPCLRFEPWSPGVSEDFLYITDTLTHCCFSSLGRRGGNQTLNIGMSGNNVGNVKHLLMHALGFWHEHNRPGRDGDIEVLWDNVQDGLQCFFDQYRNESEFTEPVPYDLASVTHISLDTWARERGLDTLRPRADTNETDVGFKQMLSPQDIQRIQALYNCTAPDPSTTTTSQPTTVEPTTVEPATTTEQSTTTYPTTTQRTTTYLPPRVVCKDQPDGKMLPYPDDCHKFYKCDGGRDFVCCCQMSLVFSAEEGTCDHAWRVPCDTPDQPTECPDGEVPDSDQCRYSRTEWSP